MTPLDDGYDETAGLALHTPFPKQSKKYYKNVALCFLVFVGFRMVLW